MCHHLNYIILFFIWNIQLWMSLTLLTSSYYWVNIISIVLNRGTRRLLCFINDLKFFFLCLKRLRANMPKIFIRALPVSCYFDLSYFIFSLLSFMQNLNACHMNLFCFVFRLYFFLLFIIPLILYFLYFCHLYCYHCHRL